MLHLTRVVTLMLLFGLPRLHVFVCVSFPWTVGYDKVGVLSSGNYFRFLSFYKKKSPNQFFFLIRIGSNRPVSVRFGYFRIKTGFSGLARFFFVLSVSIRYDFFGLRLIKPNRTG